MKLRKFQCAIFIDDGNELETIVEGEIEARNEKCAVSILLSNEAQKRNIAYYWLSQKVTGSLAKLHENQVEI